MCTSQTAVPVADVAAYCWLSSALNAHYCSTGRAYQFLNLLAELLIYYYRLFVSVKMRAELTETSYCSCSKRWVFLPTAPKVIRVVLEERSVQESKPPSSSTAGSRRLPSWKQVAGDRDAFGQCFSYLLNGKKCLKTKCAVFTVVGFDCWAATGVVPRLGLRHGDGTTTQVQRGFYPTHSSHITVGCFCSFVTVYHV